MKVGKRFEVINACTTGQAVTLQIKHTEVLHRPHSWRCNRDQCNNLHGHDYGGDQLPRLRAVTSDQGPGNQDDNCGAGCVLDRCQYVDQQRVLRERTDDLVDIDPDERI